MEVLTKLLDDSPEYDGKILKRTCLRMYGEMIRGHNMKADALEHMKLLVREAKEAYEAEQAKKAYEAEQATKTHEADQGESLCIHISHISRLREEYQILKLPSKRSRKKLSMGCLGIHTSHLT